MMYAQWITKLKAQPVADHKTDQSFSTLGVRPAMALTLASCILFQPSRATPHQQCLRRQNLGLKSVRPWH
eukprot:1146259-Amphidinium_carterae.1